MASTTTVFRTADWTNAESAHGPTLAAWLYQELRHVDSISRRYGDTFDRRLRAWKDGENPEFWTVDKWLTHLDLHPGQAPYGVWSLDSGRMQTRRARDRAA